MTYNYQFQYVLLCISGTVDHIIKILIMIYTGVFFKNFSKNAALAHLINFLIIICFSSSSIDAKKKFGVVSHLLHMCVIFQILIYLVAHQQWTHLRCLSIILVQHIHLILMQVHLVITMILLIRKSWSLYNQVWTFRSNQLRCHKIF